MMGTDRDMDGPLDFEDEDPLLMSPVINQHMKRKKKVIQLDDLLTEHYKEKGKQIEKEAKRTKARKKYDSDEDENDKEALLTKYVNSCQNQVEEIGIGEDFDEWGMQIFGNQRTRPSLVSPELGSSKLLQSFMDNELNSLVELTTSEGASFLEGLLTNGWLLKLVFAHGCLEKSVAKWTFNLMLYSSRDELRESACDFWCSVLSSENEVDSLSVKIDWIPSYSELKIALEIYGFLFNFTSNTETVNTNSGCRGPPQNVRAWIKFAAASCQLRRFSTLEAEELVAVFIFLLLDRQLLGLSVLLHECLESVLRYFKDDEWHVSCEKIGRSLASRVPRDMNCLRAVECITGVNAHSKHLRSVVAHQILVVCFDNKATGEEEILSLLISINVKDKDCNFFKLYIYLVLTENWLLFDSTFLNKPVIHEMWAVFLRNCSCQINSTDLRLFASKIRNKASYLLQGTGNR